MKRILLLVFAFWIVYGAEAQAPAAQIVLGRYPTKSQNYKLQLPDSVLSSQITNNVCDSLNAGFVFYPVNGLIEQFNSQSNVLGGSISGYTWNFGDGVIVKDTSVSSLTHNYAAPGNYTVCLTVYEDVSGSGITCQDSICKPVSVTYYAGVQDLSDNEISIYPNPSTGYIVVRSNTPIESYSIYNAVGEKLDEQLSNGNVIHFMPSMTNGIYFIYFKTGIGTLIKKLLLQYQ